MTIAIFLVIASLSASMLSANTASILPDPATITVPDVTPSKDAKIRENGYKFYYFHSSEVSFEQAYEDLRECRGHLNVAGPTALPSFIPWGEEHRNVKFEGGPMYGGLVVAAIAAIVVPKAIRGQQSNKMRRCMGTRGYDRYAVSEDNWEKLTEGDEEQLILMQAKLASGPKPDDEVVTR